MKFLDDVLKALQRGDDLKAQLFAFLGGDAQDMRLITGQKLSREDARQLLQELIPAKVEVRGICQRSIAAVAAAPHVSFDNWSEYFCNRIARSLKVGWVVAKNFRDQDPHSIPVAIGRHLHVNRPTESVRPGGTETYSERAERVFEDYVAALAKASGKNSLPIDVLFEIHSHHRTHHLEIASCGLETVEAENLIEHYRSFRRKSADLPELLLEPMHELRLKAETSKQIGSIRLEVARLAFHVEIPREARQSDEARARMCRVLIKLFEKVLMLLESRKTS